MPQQVKAFGQILQFPDGMSEDEMVAAIRANEADLNPDYKAPLKETLNSLAKKHLGVDFTSTPSIADRAEASAAEGENTAARQVPGAPVRQSAYNKALLDPQQSTGGTDITSRIADAAGNDFKGQANQQELELLRTEALKPSESGFVSSALNSAGRTIKGAGQIGSDFLNADKDNAITQYGQKLLDDNPVWAKSLEDIRDEPFVAFKEASGNSVPSMGAMVAVGTLGAGITSLAPLTGPAAPVVAAVGTAVQWLGPAAVAALPSYSGIRDAQILKDPKNEADAKSKAIAALGASAVGAIEVAFGPQQWAIAMLTKEGRSAMARKFASTSVGEAAIKGALKGGLVEGAEEIVQSPIEQLASYENPTTDESIQDTLFSGAMGVLGGTGPGAVTGAISQVKFKSIADAPTVDDAIKAATESVIQPVDPTLEDIKTTVDTRQPQAAEVLDIVLPDNSSVKARWTIVDADQLAASIKEDVNQPRDRTRAASDVQIKSIANAPDYRRLSDSPVMDVGAPVVDQDGRIVAGNGRFAGLSQAYEQGTATEYLNQLREDAARKGLNVEGIAKPVLIRQLVEPVDTRKLAIASNSGTTLQMSALEQAKLDSERMKGIENLDVNDLGDIALTSRNMTQLKDSLGTYTSTELGSLVDKGGQLSQEGMRRVRNAMLAKAYGSSPVLERLVESTDSDMRNVLGALTKSANHIIKTKGDVKPLMEAVDTYAQLKATGQPVDNFLAQQDAFSDGLGKEAEDILRFIDTNVRSQKKLTDFIKGNFREIDTTSADMFKDSNVNQLEKYLKDSGYAFTVEPAGVRDVDALDSTKKTRKEHAEKVAKFFKKKVVFVKADGPFRINGVMVPNIADTIFIDIRTDKPFDAIMAHELSHWMEQEKPAVYKQMVKSLKKVINEDATGKYAKKYGIDGATDAELTKEIVGDIMGDNFTQQSFWDKVAAANPEAFKDIAAAIIKWLKGVIVKAKANGMGSEEWLKDATKAQDIVANAVAQYTESEVASGSKPKFHKAFHGSPHDHDKFDKSKIGTGEGAQAYGYGHYFTDTKEVAEYYKSNLEKTLHVDGKPLMSTDLSDTAKSLGKFIALGTKSFEDIKSDISRRADTTAAWLIKHKDVPSAKVKFDKAKSELDAIHEFDGKLLEIKPPGGKLYEVELAPEQDEYLLWDKPLSEQSDKVKGLLQNDLRKHITSRSTQNNFTDVMYDGEALGSFEDNRVPNVVQNVANYITFSGEDLYKDYIEKLGSDKKASEYLHSLGIRGIKYLDGSSRAKGEGAYNYVIFDDNDISITAKFSKVEVDSEESRLAKKYYSPLRLWMPIPRSPGWTKEKIIRALKSRAWSRAFGKSTVLKEIAKFDSAEEFADHIYYHGTGSSVSRSLVPSITMSQAEAERSGGGGYGERYWAISLTKSKEIASNFTAQSNYGTVYGVILKKGANVQTIPGIEDAVEIEDHVVQLWNDGVDAVDIGGGEQELAVLNPAAIVRYENGETFGVFKKKKFEPLTTEQIKDIYAKSKEFAAKLQETPATERKNLEVPEVKFSKAEVENTLIAQHNLSVRNLIHADRMGGLAAPSIAVTDKAHPLTGFGEITLLSDKDLIDPARGTKIFGSDIYSPRYPSISYDFSGKPIKALNAILADGAAATGDSSYYNDNLQNDPFRELLHSSAAMYTFLSEQGKEPDIKFTEIKELSIESLKPFADGTLDSFDMSKDEGFKEAIRGYWAEKFDGEKLDEDQLRNLARSYANEVVAYRDSKRNVGKVDRQATNSALFRQILDSDLRNKFDTYLVDLVNRVEPKERIFKGYTYSGNRQYLPHDIDTVIKILKKDLRGGENFKYGLGSIRAKYSPQFKSIEHIRKSKGMLMDSASFDQVKKEVQAELDELNESLASYGTFSGYDNVETMLSDATKRGISGALKDNGFENVPDDIKVDIQTFLDKLKNMPTEYFEAKILRAVGLGEFSTAIIPDDSPPQVEAILKKNGVEDIRKYKSGDNEDRVRQIGKVTHVMFSRAPKLYSELEQALEAVNDKVFSTGPQVKLWLQSNASKLGIKKDEIYWSGIDNWLDAQGKVSKQQVVEFVRQNGVKVEDVTLGKPKELVRYEVARLNVEEAINSGASKDELESLIAARDEAEAELDVLAETTDAADTSSLDTSKHNNDKLTLPGGTDYKELVVTVPTVEKYNESDTTHFGDTGQGKQIGWIRMNTRNGGLFIEELQSQRAQQVRVIAKKRRILERFNNGEITSEQRDSAIRKLNISGGPEGMFPSAPFVSDANNKATNAYVTLLMKKALIEAVSNDHASVSWTTGDQQADRYDLSKQIDSVSWTEWPAAGKDHGVLVAYKDGDQVIKETIPLSKLPDYIGKPVAEKLLDQPDDIGGRKSLEGIDLKVGGEWAQSMYGNEQGLNLQGKPSLMTQAANDIFKHVGSGKVESINGQPGFYITPEMKSKDLPLFSRAKTVTVDGIERPTTNSEGNLINNPVKFWRWFGDSKVVDEEGRPLVVYHGTTADVRKFVGNRSKISGAFFFSSNKDVAGSGAFTGSSKGGGNVIPAYLKIINPSIKLDMTDNPMFESDVIGKARAAGYDGINVIEDKRWVAFSPNQIKSAIGNNGDYSSTNNDIRFSKAPTIPDEKLSDVDTKLIVDTFNDNVDVKVTKIWQVEDSDNIRAKSIAFQKLAEREGYEYHRDAAGAKYFWIKKKDDDAQLNVRVSDHSNVNRGRHFGDVDINLATDDGEYPVDTFASALYKIRNASVNENGDTIVDGKEIIRFSKAAPPPEETRFRRFQRMNQDSFNRFTVIKEWLAENGHTLSDKADVAAAEERFHSMVANKIEDFREQQRNPLIEKIQKAGYTLGDIEVFLKMQHAQEANAQIRKLGGDTAYGITDDEAADYLAEAPKDLAKLANEFRDITEQTKKLRLDAGILNTDITDAWEGAYQYYIPVKGEADATRGVGKGLKTNFKSKRRLGHGLRDEHVIENILLDYERAVMEVEKNRVGKHLVMMAAEMQRPDILSIDQPEKRKVLKTDTAYTVEANGVVQGVFKSREEAKMFKQLYATSMPNVAPSAIVISQTKDQRVIASASPMLADNEINVYMDGHVIRVQINDELMARAYTKLGVEQFSDIVAAGRILNGYLSKVYTGYNPEFILTNMIRDFSSGTINLTGEQGFGMATKALSNYPRMFGDLLKYAATNGKQSTKWIDSYRANGGNTGAAYLSDMERLGNEVSTEYASYQGVVANLKQGDTANAARAAGRKVFNATLKWIYNLNQAGENAMRLAAFKAMIDSGRTVNEAAKVAKNITVNFNRKGERQWAPALYLFYNASIQGTAATAHALTKGKHKGQAWALAGSMAAVGYLVASAFGGGSEDDWDEINEYTKERNMLIKAGDGYVKVPVPYGYGFFWNLGRHMAEAQRTGDWGKTPWQLATSAIEELTPFSDVVAGGQEEFRSDQVFMGFMPTAMKIAAQPIFNKQLFSGNELMPESQFDKSQPDRQKMFRATKGTMYDEVAGWLEHAGFDVSPETLKYITRTGTGGAGSLVDTTISAAMLKSEGAELDTQEIPFVRKGYMELGIKDKRAAYYKAREEARTAAEEFNRARRANDIGKMRTVAEDKRELLTLDRYANKLAAAIDAARDQQDAVRADEKLSVKEKRLKLKDMEAQEAKFYDQYLDVFKTHRKQSSH